MLKVVKGKSLAATVRGSLFSAVIYGLFLERNSCFFDKSHSQIDAIIDRVVYFVQVKNICLFLDIFLALILYSLN